MPAVPVAQVAAPAVLQVEQVEQVVKVLPKVQVRVPARRVVEEPVAAGATVPPVPDQSLQFLARHLVRHLARHLVRT